MEEELLQKKSYTKVIDFIKKQIILGELKIGEKLPAERELSAILGISRNSVREAIRTLDNMGVISSKQGAGNFLTGNFESSLIESMSMMFLLNKINYEQISQLRRGLETQALLLAIDNISENEINELKEIILELDAENGNNSEEMNVKLDKKLHYHIAFASKNYLIIDILEALSEVMDRFIGDLRREILMNEKRKYMLQEAHKEMVKSLVTKDKSLAYESINKHFSVVDENLLEKSDEALLKINQKGINIRNM
ncbi:MAG: regulatory protein GntR [Bacillota bacterium]|jgi:GntR family transcriptional repressor for pyruvate dehydrogenase complex|nr:regulatory protein GntR [Bacillota bacterium]